MIKGFLYIAIFIFAIKAFNINAKELTYDDIFPTDRVLDIQITISEENWNTLRFQSRGFQDVLKPSRQFAPPEHPYSYVEASVSIDGVEFPKVGIRKKGFIGSQSHNRPSLKIKLNEFDKKGEIDGLTNLTFNNNQQDMMQISQFMGYALFNAVGSPAPLCAYAQVTVNGNNLGVYSHVESFRNPLLKRAFGNDEGTLFEGTVVDFHEEWDMSFEHKRGKEKRGRKHIRALIDVLAEDHVTEQEIGELVDLDDFYRFWAIEGLLGFWDGYSGNNNNFFVYLNPDTDKFHFLPWGADSLFSNFDMQKRGRNARMPISVKTQGLIAYKLYQLDEGKERYAETIRSILNEHWNEDQMLAEVDRIATLVKPHMIPQQLKFGDKEQWWERRNVTFDQKLEEARHFIRTRKSAILSEISGGMPEWNRRPNPPFVIPEDEDWGKPEMVKLPQKNLWGAARTGDLEGIKRYLDEGADINELSDEADLSPLSWATLFGQLKAAELLLEHGADVNTGQGDGGTPFHIAVFLGRAEMAKLLMDNGADVNRENHGGDPPMSGLYAPWRMVNSINLSFQLKLDPKKVGTGRAKIAKMLNADFDVNMLKGRVDIWDAAFNGDLEVLQKAIEEGTDVNSRNRESGDPLLSIAALMGHADMVAFLLDKGADINARNRDKGTALHSAAFLGRSDVVKLLLDRGINAGFRNSFNGTAVDSAKTDWGITQGILRLFDIKIDDIELKEGRKEVIKIISDHVKDLPEPSSNIWSASASGDLEALNKAIDDKVDVNALDPKFGMTPLSYAALNGRTDAVELLINHGAEVNGLNRDGGTPIHGSVFLGHVETTKLLLKKGADKNIRKHDGLLPLDAAYVDWGLTQFVVGLLEMKVEQKKVEAGRKEVIKLLSNQER